MKNFDNIIIGFGKAGKTLAGALAATGQSTAIIERDAGRFGGTCINVACIPTKSLEYSARLSGLQGGDFNAKAERYAAAVAEKNRLTAMLREKNYQKALAAGVEVLVGAAAFINARQMSVAMADGSVERLQGRRFFINTGSRPIIPPIPGLKDSRFAYTSETLVDNDKLPQRLAIIGGGYIGLEFASYFANFGSQVTVIQNDAAFLPREDADIAQAVLDSLRGRDVNILLSTEIIEIVDREQQAILRLRGPQGELEVEAEAVLVATGRRAETEGLNLAAAGVETDQRGAVRVDQYLRSSVPHIWAMGDAAGGLQFTYISLDDFRIVKAQLLGGEARHTANRGHIPYTVFLDPPLSRLGMTEAEARQQGHQIKIALLPAAAIPKAQVLRKPAGLLKAIVDADSGLLLGAHLFCAESQEMINLLKLCMDAQLPYTQLRDNIYNHPTMSEAFNDLLAL